MQERPPPISEDCPDATQGTSGHVWEAPVFKRVETADKDGRLYANATTGNFFLHQCSGNHYILYILYSESVYSLTLRQCIFLNIHGQE